MTQWRWHEFAQLRPEVLYALLKLRSDIFVVEQNCVFSDMDDVDQACEHLCGFDGACLLAYLRIVPPGAKLKEASLGRLVVARHARGRGLARAAVQHGLERLKQKFPGAPIRIGAQHYLDRFYASFGFVQTSEPFMEDGIPHIEMIYSGSSASSVRGPTRSVGC